MSDMQRDKQFWDMTDSFIQLANTHLNEAKPSRVSASALFAASRFNAFVITAAADKFKEANRGGNADEIAEQSQALIDRVQQSHEKVQEHEVKHLPEHDLSGFDGLDMGR